MFDIVFFFIRNIKKGLRLGNPSGGFRSEFLRTGGEFMQIRFANLGGASHSETLANFVIKRYRDLYSAFFSENGNSENRKITVPDTLMIGEVIRYAQPTFRFRHPFAGIVIQVADVVLRKDEKRAMYGIPYGKQTCYRPFLYGRYGAFSCHARLLCILVEETEFPWFPGTRRFYALISIVKRSAFSLPLPPPQVARFTSGVIPIQSAARMFNHPKTHEKD
jgi:hypothetical protein